MGTKQIGMPYLMDTNEQKVEINGVGGVSHLFLGISANKSMKISSSKGINLIEYRIR